MSDWGVVHRESARAAARLRTDAFSAARARRDRVGPPSPVGVVARLRRRRSPAAGVVSRGPSVRPT